MLVVHEAHPKLPYFPVSIFDWYHDSARTISAKTESTPDGKRKGTNSNTIHPSNRMYSIDGVEVGSHPWVSTLVNGRGRYKDNNMPLTTFHVKSGQRYMFRICNTGAELGLEYSIDNHDMIVVGCDGYDIHPIRVTAFITYPGECTDVEVDAKQRPDLYWIRVKTLKHGKGPNLEDDGKHEEGHAILAYDDISALHDPSSKSTECNRQHICYVLNCPFLDYPAGTYKQCISLADARSMDHRIIPLMGVDDESYEEYFLNFGFQNGPSINAIAFEPPKVPMFQHYTNDQVKKCSSQNCDDGCKCTHTVTLPHNKTVQLVLSNIVSGEGFTSPHPIHLHAHGFAVMKMGYPSYDSETGRKLGDNDDLYCEDKKCTSVKWSGRRPRLNKDSPPVKDTVTLPSGGYAVIRFRADNPGYWLLHCHMESHAVGGMMLLIEEAPGEIPPTPPHFPTCIEFDWSAREFDLYVKSQRKMTPLAEDFYLGHYGSQGSGSHPHEYSYEQGEQGQSGYEPVKSDDSEKSYEYDSEAVENSEEKHEPSEPKEDNKSKEHAYGYSYEEPPKADSTEKEESKEVSKEEKPEEDSKEEDKYPSYGYNYETSGNKEEEHGYGDEDDYSKEGHMRFMARLYYDPTRRFMISYLKEKDDVSVFELHGRQAGKLLKYFKTRHNIM